MASVPRDPDAFPVDPMQQFEVSPLIPLRVGGLDISFTNVSLFMVIVTALVCGGLLFATRSTQLHPSRLQAAVEGLYGFLRTMLISNAGPNTLQYFPFIFTLFLFIAACNLVGMIPYTVTVTAQLAVALALALFIFIGVTVIGFMKHGFGYLRLFVPSGIPMWLLPLLAVIEFISYFIRPISLSVRLFANMMAGHTMLKVVSGFVVLMGFAGVLPLLFMSVFSALEIIIALLQAFIFTVLTCIYLNDALHPQH